MTIVFFRYDLVFYRSSMRTVILWRPFVLSFLMIGQAPAALLPIYTYNFEICYDRNLIIGLTYSWPIQIAITIVSLLIILYLVSVVKLASWAKQDFLTEKAIKCVSVSLGISKLIGIFIFCLIMATSMIALLAMADTREYYYFSLIELTHIVSLGIVAAVHPCILKQIPEVQSMEQ